jgi:hypothetical protein
MPYSDIDLHKRSLVIHTEGEDGTAVREVELATARTGVSGPDTSRSACMLATRIFPSGFAIPPVRSHSSDASGKRAVTLLENLRLSWDFE